MTESLPDQTGDEGAMTTCIFLPASYRNEPPQRPRKKGSNPCHSERSEESLFPFMDLNRSEIPRFAQNDKEKYFFRSLFSRDIKTPRKIGR
jgi:hypothetical protein